MNAFDIIRMAVGNSFRSKLRTTLTVVAIFIGAFTLTITSAIGTGVSSFIETQVASVGAPDVLSITQTAKDAPAAEEGPARYDPDKAIVTAAFTGDGSQLSTGILTADDLATIKRVDGILDVSAAQQVNPRFVAYGENDKYELVVNSNSSLTDPELAAGSQLEAETGERQILLVTSYVDTLGFADAEAAVGVTVTIGVADYAGTMHEVVATVAGVQNESILAAGAALNQSLADELYRVQNIGVPLNSIEGPIQATAHFDPAASDEQIDAIQADLADQGYTAVTVADQIGMIQTVISGIIGVLNAFAIIALIAAGFGIINTLLMSVQERTREIGLMKAMGMGSRSIYALFSIEAVFIGFLGSVIGALAAIGVGSLANGFLAGTVLADLEGLQVLRFEPVPVGVVVLLVMGIAYLAGTLPARHASRQNPIDALRYE